MKPWSRILVLVCTAPFLFALEPLPPPYHQYQVSGTIGREGGGELSNFVVTLVGKSSTHPPDSKYTAGHTYSIDGARDTIP